MGVKYFLRSNKTGKQFQIIRRDKAKNTVTLKGDIAEFEEAFDMQKFKQWGYTLEKEDAEEDA